MGNCLRKRYSNAKEITDNPMITISIFSNIFVFSRM
jgi:hypothetical protein